jgi:diguanylate cyclase (GGDEF)-like protein
VKKVKKLFRRRGVEEPAPGSDADIEGRVSGPDDRSFSPEWSRKGVQTMLREFGAGGAGPAAAGAGRAVHTLRYDQLWQLSMADPHTGLVNQLLLLDRLTQALVRRHRHGGEVVVCRIDLHNLDEVNQMHGYTTGNAVLSETARRLTSVVRAEDTLGRVGGTEFAVVLAVDGAPAVGALARRLRRALDEPMTVGGRRILLQADLAVALAAPQESAEDVLARAGRLNRTGGHG